MGQGQMDLALELLKKSSHQGSWLCLKNLHLVTSWLTTLEKVVFSSSALDRSTFAFFFSALVEGTERVETAQRFSALVDVRSASEISDHSPSIEHQNHLRSAARPEEKSSSNLRNVDAGRVQQRQRRAFTDVVRARLVSRHCARTSQIHSTGLDEVLRVFPGGSACRIRNHPSALRTGRTTV